MSELIKQGLFTSNANSSLNINSFLSNKDIALKPLDFLEESFKSFSDNLHNKTSRMFKMFNQQDHLNLTFLSSAFDSLVNSHEEINIDNVSLKNIKT